MSPLPASRLRRSRMVDALAAAVITLGGGSVLLAVAFLMVFLVAQCLPLFRGGAARPEPTVPAAAKPLAAVEDEYREHVFLLGDDAVLRAVPGGDLQPLALEGARPPVAQARASAAGTLLAVVDAAGVLQVDEFRTEVEWRGERRRIVPSLRRVLALPLAAPASVLAVAGDAATPRALVSGNSGTLVLAGVGSEARAIRLAVPSPPLVGALAADGREAWLATAQQLSWFSLDADAAAASPEATVPLRATPSAAALVLGDATLLLGDDAGTVAAWQVVTGPVAGSHLLDLAGVFSGGAAVRALAVSQRNKGFAIERDGGLELAYLTGRRILATLPRFPADARAIGFAPRGDGFYAVTGGGEVHRWRLDLPHPEVDLATLFLPVRYEGYTRPSLVWQSTGGSESFEPKLSLVPLLVGTLKGAFYALLFSGPCALAAALYVSQFAGARLRTVAKPVVEMMAAVPSVVIGFLAALFFAPLLQRHVVGTLSLLVLLPVAITAAAVGWEMVPARRRRRVTATGELALVAGVCALAAAASFGAERLVEVRLFGGDFKAWLIAAAGVTFDQRNAVVVGFALGFAVIPIIFTLADDAFTNVPPSLISASLALGATRWQAARTVAIPAASPGLFAAVMTGFGRAVGETMIVLMATGNTPVLSFSPFDGMRTMSACIAVELPEAPFGGTLYRVLILTALLLFLMTFVINTAAVMVANRLRRRFGRLAA
ncbi:MAG TPA: ABC transporter permease subunit [Thermoanaerobaculaceae bacterium]|nr:ABC transporter permease subunit [Thermoanaerobaculaceae bacterium]